MSEGLKRSVTIAGHRTSLSLEPEFWQALRETALAEGRTTTAIIREVDSKRGKRNLSSAVRVWLLMCKKSESRPQATVTPIPRSSEAGSTSGAKGLAK